MPSSTDSQKPFWMPDTQGFLAIAIIVLIAAIVMILLTHPPAIDERTSGVLMTIVGVLIACLKDVYSFFFGSSSGSKSKDDAMVKLATEPEPPPVAPLAPIAPIAPLAPIAPVAPLAPIAPVEPAAETPITQNNP